MNSKFEKGWNYYANNTSIYTSQIDSVDWINNIEKEIKKLENDINSFDKVKTSTSFLKGDIAEFWHTDTFNINAALNKSSTKAVADRSHELGSVDIKIIDNNNNTINTNSLKYYENAAASAKAQSISYFQKYKEFVSKGHNVSFEEYLKNNGISDNSVLHDRLYSGQLSIIPSDQYDLAIQFLEKKIAKESITRPDQVNRYKETLNLLKTKVTDTKGNESIELTKEESEQLARLSKQGKFNAEDYGLSSDILIEYEMLLKDSFKSGINAAMLSMVLKLGPELYQAIDYLIKKGEIDKDQLKETGISTINAGSESFLKGFISAMITFSCRSGHFGEKLKTINPSIISIATVFSLNVMKDSYKVSTGKINRSQLAENLIRDSIVSAAALAGGTIGQYFIKVPVLGYLIGSFVGTLLGSFTFESSKKVALSYCIDTGFTLFGLVEQDYVLPKEIIESMGIETFDYEKMEFDTLNPNCFEVDKFEPRDDIVDNLDIYILRRGVIGVNLVGYVN